MTREEELDWLYRLRSEIYVYMPKEWIIPMENALDMAIKALEQKPIDKSAMMYEIYMEGVNMSGEYQGCWVRFKDIEKIVDKYMGDKE